MHKMLSWKKAKKYLLGYSRLRGKPKKYFLGSPFLHREGGQGVRFPRTAQNPLVFPDA